MTLYPEVLDDESGATHRYRWYWDPDQTLVRMESGGRWPHLSRLRQGGAAQGADGVGGGDDGRGQPGGAGETPCPH